MSVSPRTSTVGLLLAAGAGRRYGRPKALVTADGEPWVLRGVRTLLAGGCAEVLVVTGAEAEQVEEILTGIPVPDVADAPPGGQPHAVVNWVRCGTWERGMGESLRSGLTGLATRGRSAPRQALVHLVDLPDVGPEVVARVLAAAGERTAALARAAYLGIPGHPVLLGRDHWEAVARGASGDQGARAYLRTAGPLLVECGDLATGADRDAPA